MCNCIVNSLHAVAVYMVLIEMYPFFVSSFCSHFPSIRLRSILDGGKVIEAVVTRRFPLPPSIIGRATYVHIYVLPPAVWDDRINVPSICWRSPRPLSNDRPKCKQQSIPSILYDHRDYDRRRICCDHTHPTETCIGVWRKSSKCWQLHQAQILIWIQRLSAKRVPAFLFNVFNIYIYQIPYV